MDKKRCRQEEDAAAAVRRGEAHDAHAQSAEDSAVEADAVEVVVVEPFHGGSHAQLVELLVSDLLEPAQVRHAVCSLPPRKWHWRLMASSMYFAAAIPRSASLRVLFITAMVNLAELVGLRPDLGSSHVRKVLYFHENQLTYPFQLATAAASDSTEKKPLRKVAAEDFQVPWAQVVSCLAADELVFNSGFNRTSFLDKVDAFVNKIPEPELRHRGLAAQLRAKSRVLYFPLVVPPASSPTLVKSTELLTILWSHRWEYDKNPDEFFQTLLELDRAGLHFQVIVLGETFGSSPPIFATAKAQLESSANVTIVHWGYAESKARYWQLLRVADVVVSTSLHEFYGVAVLEAVMCGCYPLVPNRLVYPEFFSGANLFNTQRQLFKTLKYFCANPAVARKFGPEKSHDFDKLTWKAMQPEYEAMLLGWRQDARPPKTDARGRHMTHQPIQ